MIRSSNEVQMDTNEGKPIYLSEADIPGAKLSGPMDAHMVAQVR